MVTVSITTTYNSFSREDLITSTPFAVVESCLLQNMQIRHGPVLASVSMEYKALQKQRSMFEISLSYLFICCTLTRPHHVFLSVWSLNPPRKQFPWLSSCTFRMTYLLLYSARGYQLAYWTSCPFYRCPHSLTLK